jgi:hypothetical protein
MTHPTVWNTKANFKVVRLDVCNIRDRERNIFSWLAIAVNPRNVARKTIKLPMEDGRLPGFSLEEIKLRNQ